MSWNEPGRGNRDPWNRDNHSGGGKGPQWNDLFGKLRKHMGRFGNGAGGIVTIIVALILAWLLLSSYTVIGARETGVVLRFGAYSRSLPPGLHWKLPTPIEEVYKVKTSQIRSVSDSVSMLTNDENIVQIDFNVQWLVADARKYLFSMRDPGQTINNAAEAAVRAVVGANTMDTILSGQGAEVVAKTRQVLQKTLDKYHAGLKVTEISFQNVAPPKEVRAAFDDVNKAREDKQRIENEAHAYASKVVPVARGKAARIRAEAAAYKATRIAGAEGDVDRFDKVLKQYEAAPYVTRERLWLETMEDVVAPHAKIVDGSHGRNVLYLGAPDAERAKSGVATSLPAVNGTTNDAQQVESVSGAKGGAQ